MRGLMEFLEELDPMKIGAIVNHCFEFDRMLNFWQGALHHVPRHPARDGRVVLRDPTDQGRIFLFRHAICARECATGCTIDCKPDRALWKRAFADPPEYQDWKRLLHHFYDPLPVVEHYECVASNAS